MKQKQQLTDEQEIELHDLIYSWQLIEFDAPFWFDGDADYCLACAKKHGDDFDGGFTCECDNPPACEDCGLPLSHTLTDYGAAQELEYYETNGLRGSDEERYALVNISGGIPMSYQSRLWALIVANPVIKSGEATE